MSEPIGLFVAKEIASYAIARGLDKVLAQRKTFEKRMAKVINEAIDEFHGQFPIPDAEGKFAFYKSQILLEELLKFRFWGDGAYEVDEDTLIDHLSKNPNVIPPTQQQVQAFFEIFERHRKNDDLLKKLEIEENFRQQIFHNSDKLNQILQIVKSPASTSEAFPKELTAVSRISKRDIVGREAELESIRRSLLENRETVLVNGMGGIGKTTLAAVYADAFYDDYDHLAWLTIETDLPAAIAANYTLLSNLRLLNIPPEQQFDSCLNALRTLASAKPVLLIIDNAGGNLAGHFDRLPKAPACHLLVTSRQRIAPFHIIEVDFLPPDEAIKLFLKHNTRLTREEAARIVKDFEYHTLTIEILAKSAQKQRWRLAEIGQALAKDAATDIQVGHSGYQKIDRIKTYLANIFRLSAENEFEIYSLKQFLFLPNEWLAYDFLEKLLQRERLDWHEDFAARLENLFERGWLQKDLARDSYKLHPVLAEALAPQLDVSWEDISYLCESVTEILDLDQAKENPIDKFQYVPFGDAILKQAGERFANELSLLKNNLALRHYELGEHEKARDLLELALKSALENFGPKHPNVAVRQSNLANVYSALGEYEKARALLELALKSDLENFGPQHPTVAVRQSNLATVYSDLGEYEKARDLLEAALKSDLENFGPKHPNVAVRQSNLANVYSALGEYEKARDLWMKAYEILLMKFGENHPHTKTVKRFLENSRA